MRLIKEKPIFLFILVVFVLASCNNSNQQKDTKDQPVKEKEANVEVEVFDAMKIKDQIVETIQQTADIKQVIDKLNEADASYINELTVPAENVEKYITTTQQSLGLGMYSIDLYYAHVFDRSDIVSQILDLEQQLIDKLGLTDEFMLSKSYSERIRNNIENNDSLDYLVVESMNYYHHQFSESDQPGVYGISFIGSNIEALHILTQLALLAPEKDGLLKILSGQDGRIKSVFSLMELLSGNESVKPLYEEMIPIAKFFEKNPEIGEEQLETLAPMIEGIRDKML